MVVMKTLYNLSQRPDVKKILHGCKIVIISGLVIITVGTMTFFGAQDIANRTKKHMFGKHEKKSMKYKNLSEKIANDVYQIQR